MVLEDSSCRDRGRKAWSIRETPERLAQAVAEQVVRLAALAQQCGMDGVVCSAREIAPIRARCGDDFLLVVPGIRPAGGELGDQKRIMTPAEAMSAGATSLVVGRPITKAEDPAAAARAIVEEAAATRV